MSNQEKKKREIERKKLLKTESYYIGLRKHHDVYMRYKEELCTKIEGLDKDKLVDQTTVSSMQRLDVAVLQPCV